MNSKIIVVYDSKYGNTQTYAKWIAKELSCEYKNVKDIGSLYDYETIIFGSSVYASRIKNAIKVKDYLDKNLIVFTVTLSDPKKTDFTEIKEMNFSFDTNHKIKFFHLRGGLDYKNLGLIHKAMMWMMKKVVLEKIPENKRNDEQNIMLDCSERKLDFLDKKSITPIIEYIKGVM